MALEEVLRARPSVNAAPCRTDSLTHIQRRLGSTDARANLDSILVDLDGRQVRHANLVRDVLRNWWTELEPGAK